MLARPAPHTLPRPRHTITREDDEEGEGGGGGVGPSRSRHETVSANTDHIPVPTRAVRCVRRWETSALCVRCGGGAVSEEADDPAPALPREGEARDTATAERGEREDGDIASGGGAATPWPLPLLRPEPTVVHSSMWGEKGLDLMGRRGESIAGPWMD